MAACPSEAILKQYIEDSLDPVQSDAIEDHLETCERCAQSADRFSSDVDVELGSFIDIEQLESPDWLCEVLRNALPGFQDFEFLSSGSFGCVFRAHEMKLSRRVAVKVLKPSLAASPSQVERFLKEGQNASAVQHPNVVEVYRVESIALPEKGGFLPCVVMEYIEGPTLLEYLQGHVVDEKQAVQIILAVANGLEALHTRGIVHRDIKPENVLLPNSGPSHLSWAKIADFGIATALDDRRSIEVHYAIGTPHYLSPEQAGRPQVSAREKAPPPTIDQRSDIYSLGVVMYLLLTGRLPGKSSFSESSADGTSSVPDNGDLASICQKARHIDPEQRYSSIGALREDLLRWQNHEPVHAYDYSTRDLISLRYQRNPTAFTLTVVAMIAMIAGTVVSLLFARNARTNAEIARGHQKEAKDALIKETAARHNADVLYYASQIGSAQREWELGNVRRARAHLANCRPHLRGWEYDYLYTLFNRYQTTLKGHDGPVTSVTFSPDGRRILSAGWDGIVRIWDVANANQITNITHNPDSTLPRIHISVAISRDGKLVVSGSEDKTLKLWDTATGEEIQEFEECDGGINSVAFSPDGSKIVSGSWPNRLKLWDVANGATIHTLKGHNSNVTCVTFSPDGTHVVSASKDETLMIWNVATGKATRTLKGHIGEVTSVAFSPDGALIVSGGEDHDLIVWDTPSGKPIRTLRGHQDDVSCVAFSSDGRLVVSGSYDDTLKLWDLNTGEELRTFKGHNSDISSVMFSPDGSQIVSGSADATLRLWDLAPADQTAFNVIRHFGISVLALSLNGKRAIASEHDGKVTIWDTSTGQLIKTLVHAADFRKQATKVASNSDGSIIASADGTMLKLWNASTADEMLISPSDGSYCCVALNCDGSQIVAGIVARDSHSFRIWDVHSGNVIQAFQGTDKLGVPNCVAFSPDSTHIVVGGVGGFPKSERVMVYNVSAGRIAWAAQGHTSIVRSVAYSRDGNRVVSTGGDATLKVWDSHTGEELLALTGHDDFGGQHGRLGSYLPNFTSFELGGINCAAFSPDGTRIVSGGSDKEIKVWDSTIGVEMLTIRVHGRAIEGVAFSDDGRRIVSGSLDGDVIVSDSSNSEWPPSSAH